MIAFGFTGYYAGQEAADPPDPDFRVIARPHVVPVHLDLGGVQLTGGQHATLDRFLRDAEAEAALARAAITTNNRANSAIAAGDQADADRQVEAYYGYIGRIAGLLDDEAAARTALVAAFSGQLGSLTLTTAQVQQAQALAAANDVPPQVADQLERQGVPASFLADKLAAFATADPAGIAGRNLLGGFDDPAILAQMHTLAQDLRQDVLLHGFPLPGGGDD